MTRGRVAFLQFSSTKTVTQRQRGLCVVRVEDVMLRVRCRLAAVAASRALLPPSRRARPSVYLQRRRGKRIAPSLLREALAVETYGYRKAAEYRQGRYSCWRSGSPREKASRAPADLSSNADLCEDICIPQRAYGNEKCNRVLVHCLKLLKLFWVFPG